MDFIMTKFNITPFKNADANIIGSTSIINFMKL